MCKTIIELITKMSAEEAGNLIQFGIALIAIIALFLQSRSTRKQLKLQNFMEYTKRYQEIILNFPENINEPSFKINEVTPEDSKNKTMRYMRAYFDLCFEEYILHKKKFIDDDLWEIWKNGMIVALSKPAFQQAWKIIIVNSRFGDGFENFIDKQVIS